MELLISYLQVLGITYLLSESILLETPREWITKKVNIRLFGDLIYCPICLSFWVALLITQSLILAFAFMGLTYLWQTINQ